MDKSRTTFMAILLSCTLTAQAVPPVTYHSSNIARICAVLSHQALDQLQSGWNTIDNNGHRLVVRVNDANQVEHIGAKLFPLDLRQGNDLTVYDFVEQTYLKYLMKISGDQSDGVTTQGSLQPAASGVRFLSGAWSDLANVNDSTQVNVQCIENVKYKVEWSNPDGVIALIEVPIHYDRLLQAGRNELEQIYLRDMLAYKKPTTNDKSLAGTAVGTPTPSQSDDAVHVSKGKTHHQANINQNRYYTLVDGKYSLIHDASHPVETLINMINAYESLTNDVVVKIKFNLYGNQKRYETLPLSQFLAYAASRHESAYVGLEKETDDVVELSLFLDNPGSGYEHVVFITCDRAHVADPDCVLQAEAYLYSPTGAN